VEIYPARIKLRNDTIISEAVTILAWLRDITPLGIGRSGLFSLSISTSRISLRAFQEHINAQTDKPCKIVIDANSSLGKPSKASKAPNNTPISPVNELPNRNKVNHELRVD
jgi:hypothetical protein